MKYLINQRKTSTLVVAAPIILLTEKDSKLKFMHKEKVIHICMEYGNIQRDLNLGHFMSSNISITPYNRNRTEISVNNVIKLKICSTNFSSFIVFKQQR